MLRLLRGQARLMQLRRFTSVHVSDEVQQALRECKPVVALESTIISHGMPYPQNVAVAKEVEAICRQAGAVPATVAVINGFPKVGLHDADFELLGKAEQHKVKKCSRRDLPIVCAAGQNAATTVAGTMFLAHKAGIRVFATGGIGGVHREVLETLDISADLIELSKTPVAVVCAGIKSILDVPKSLEYLETQGVPVVGFGCDEFPAFFHNHSGVKCPSRLDTPVDVARMLATMDGLGMGTGAVIAVPNPSPADPQVVDAAIRQALEEARQQDVAGWQITPFLLARVNELTGGRSLQANIELIKNNARRASEIAVALAHTAPRPAHSMAARIAHPAAESAVAAKAKTEAEAEGGDTPAAPAAQHAVPVSTEPEKTTRAAPSPRVGGRTQIMVIGGAVVDLSTRPLEGRQLLPGTSNPGTLFQSFGGVGRNVAEAAARLGARVGLLSAIADDAMGKSLMEHCLSASIDTKYMKVVPSEDGKHRTATYSAVLDADGQLHVAVADMRILSNLSFEDVRQIAMDIRDADFVVTDGNLDKKTFAGIAGLCGTYNVPLVFEPTSVPKAVLPVSADTLGALDIVKPNEKELVAMVEACYEQGLFVENLAQVQTTLATYQKSGTVSSQDLRLLGASLLRAMNRHSATISTVSGTGTPRKLTGKHILVTLGDAGLMWVGPASELGQKYAVDEQVAVAMMRAVKSPVLSCTGAGDTLLGTVLWGLVNGKSMRQSIIAGMEAARMSVASPFAVSPELTESVLEASVQKNAHLYQ